MLKKETALREKLKRLRKEHKLEDISLSWIESHATAIGIPDLHYCYNGIEGWVELKAFPDIDIRANQCVWMETNIKAGGKPFFIIEADNRLLTISGLWCRHMRADPSLVNILRLAAPLKREFTKENFLTILSKKDEIYEQARSNIGR